MKVFATCLECLKELGMPSFEPLMAPYYDDRISYIECARGHRSALLLQSQKFEVLLESGANALSNSFTLEAAATFSAGLERFIEFGLKVLSIHRGLSSETYEKMFKNMARQSERQLGAFMALYAVEANEIYAPNSKIVEFRNAVIHKGHIPTPEEAEQFCSLVYAEIVGLYEKLEAFAGAAIQAAVTNDLLARNQALPKGMPTATTTGTGFFCMAHKDKKKTFKEAYDAHLKQVAAIEAATPEMKKLHDALMLLSNA